MSELNDHPLREYLDKRSYRNHEARLKGIKAYNAVAKQEAEAHAESLRETAEGLVEAGLSLREISNFLNEHGHHTRNGNPFTVGTTARLLKRLGLQTRFTKAFDSLED